MNERTKDFIKEEKAAATILEYTIILPLVMAIVFVLVFTGYIQHQKAVIQAATARGAILASKMIADPSYMEIVTIDASKDINDIKSVSIADGSIKNEPYRYLFRGSSTLNDISSQVNDLIVRNQIFLTNTPSVEAKEIAGVFRKVVVTARQDYSIPKLLPGLDLPPIVTIESESTIYVNQPAEFIRNADFAMDIVKEFSNTVVTKIKTIFDKVNFFKSKVN